MLLGRPWTGLDRVGQGQKTTLSKLKALRHNMFGHVGTRWTGLKAPFSPGKKRKSTILIEIFLYFSSRQYIRLTVSTLSTEPRNHCAPMGLAWTGTKSDPVQPCPTVSA